MSLKLPTVIELKGGGLTGHNLSPDQLSSMLRTLYAVDAKFGAAIDLDPLPVIVGIRHRPGESCGYSLRGHKDYGDSGTTQVLTLFPTNTVVRLDTRYVDNYRNHQDPATFKIKRIKR